MDRTVGIPVAGTPAYANRSTIDAQTQLAHCLRLLEEGLLRLEAARTRIVWGTVSRDRGDLAAESC